MVVRQIDLDGRNRVDGRAMEDYGDYSQAAILCHDVSWLDSVFAGESILYIEVDIKHIVTFILFNN